MRCAFIYNPAAGPNRDRRSKQLSRIAAAVTGLGHGVELAATTAPGSAAMQAQEAVRGGAEIVFACGGDGTVHEVLQGLVSEAGEHAAALGVIPLGSANVLARHLRFSLDPVRAALEQVRADPVAIPVGKLAFGGQARYFILMAGAGPDGALVYDLLAADKSHLGRLAYTIHAARLFATRRFRPFEVEFVDAATGAAVTQPAIAAMAVRVNDLGGLFRKLIPRRASIEDARLQLIILRPPAALSLPMWFICGWLHLHGLNRFLSVAEATGCQCRPLSGPAPHFEADGEWVGRIPMQVSLVPNALRILWPSRASRQKSQEESAVRKDAQVGYQ